MSNRKFSGFKGRLGLNGDEEGPFLRLLDEAFDDVSRGGGSSGGGGGTTVIFRNSGGGGSSTPSSTPTAPTIPPPQAPQELQTISISSNISFQAGQLVHYQGKAITLADVTTGKRAGWVVDGSSGGVVTLRRYLLEGDVKNTGTGYDETGYLYLYTNGGVTRDKSQIMDSEGVLQGSCQFLQIVGVWSGLSTTNPKAGFIRGGIWIYPDVG